MKRLFSVLMALAFGLALTTSAYAYIDDTPIGIDDNVSVFVSIAAQVGFFISTPGSAADNEVTWGAVDIAQQILTVSPQRIKVDYSSNYPAWAVQMYTDNTGVGGPLNGLTVAQQFTQSTTVDNGETGLFFSAGGLIGAGNKASRVGLAWHGDVNEVGAQPTNPLTNNLAGWTFVADKKTRLYDGTGPKTDPINYPVGDFNFDTNGFARVLQGGTGNQSGALMQGPGFPNADGSIALWVAGGFNGAAPDSYSTALQFDIVHF